MGLRIKAIKDKYNQDGFWAATKEVPVQGWDLAKKNPWKTGGGIAGTSLLIVALALTGYYYKCPDSGYARLINDLGSGIVAVFGKSAEWIQANKEITILASCLLISAVIIGALTYKNHDKASKLDEVGKFVNEVDPNSGPQTILDGLRGILKLSPVQGHSE
ncbi:hypothetical protein [Wolbachia endosymbiont of Ctenocephalides felis wCfeT]|uniref:hypothetical protein n=1 Tax=Wolbachia endosymbiont of Ctenocephalides felis wCfeT TaxID=2732593 RepID=UPI001447D903|nr:hypothetical protein [Wolbachia endosymbiont of Ctenocephalides felis wCfeT]